MITRIMIYVLALHAAAIWGRLSSRNPSPVEFETTLPTHLTYWMAVEYSQQALIRKQTRKEEAAIGLDKLILNE